MSHDMAIDVFKEPISAQATDLQGVFVNHAFVNDTQDTVEHVPSEEETPKKPCLTLSGLKKSIKKHEPCLKRWALFLLFILYNVFMVFAILSTWQEAASYCDGIKFLSVITAFAYLIILYKCILKRLLKRCSSSKLWSCLNSIPGSSIARRVTWSLLICGFSIFVIVDSSQNRYKLVSLGGLFVLIFLGTLFSKNYKKVDWSLVFTGLLLQISFAFLILRLSWGRAIFQCIGDKVKTFLEFTDAGTSFLFGYLVTGVVPNAPPHNAIFAFKVLPVIVFFSCFVSALYHLGAMQVVVSNLGWFLNKTMGTTACESMNAAGNVFLGMTEAPLIIKPYLHLMTNSELHCVMTGGFATIAGSVLAAYINFGIPASHLLSASVMSAPAALAFAKLFYPEETKSATGLDIISAHTQKEANVIAAVASGASSSISLIANIVVNLIGFIALMAFIDSLLGWFGSLVNFEELTFAWLLSKLFYPIALSMGVNLKDVLNVAHLIGLKTVINEFVAYQKLSEIKSQLTERSVIIVTYALCGFSNIGSIGIMLGSLGAMVPDRKADISRIIVRAFISGSAACFMTACIAGVVID